MRLLVYDIQGKSFVKARQFKKLSASRVKLIARWKLQKSSVVAQRSEQVGSEQVKAYDCYKLLIIKRKVQVLFIDKR